MMTDIDGELVPWLLTPDSKVLELILKCGEEGGTEQALYILLGFCLFVSVGLDPLLEHCSLSHRCP